MKELYFSPEIKFISFLASEKVAADWDLDFGKFGISLSTGSTVVSNTDIKIPIKG